MIAFPGMLINPAKSAGIKIPANVEDYNIKDYLHFYVFSILQLGASMPSSNAHFENAKVIAEIPEEELKTMTLNDVIAKGISIGFPIP